MPNTTPEKTLTIATNKNYIPFDFAKLLSTDEIISVYIEHGIELIEQDAIEVSKFLQQWLEVLYLQYKRTNTIKDEQQKSHIILPSEFRRAS